MNLPLQLRRDTRPLLRGILGILFVAACVFAYSSWSVVDATLDNSVQPIEVNRAGAQRRLSERIAYESARLEADPTGQGAREHLHDAAMRLRAIRMGLLGGSADLELDGEVPDEVRSLYFDTGSSDTGSSDTGSGDGASGDGEAEAVGTSLHDRMERYEESALALAATPGIDRAALEVIYFEAQDERLVHDLDAVVSALDHALASNQRALRTSVVTASLVLGGLGLVMAAAIITALRRADRRVGAIQELADDLAASEKMYRTTMNSLLDCVVIQDAQGRVIWANTAASAAAMEKLGRELSEGVVSGDLIPDLFEEDGTPLTPEMRPPRRALDTGEPVVGQLVSTAPGDSQRWFCCNATPVHVNGGPARVVLAFTDVTEERRLQASVEAHERRFRLAVQNAPIGKALLDADSNIVDANGALAELLGGKASELIGTAFTSLLYPASRSSVVERIDAMQHGDEVACRLETRLVDRSGRVVDVLVALASIKDDAADPTLIVQILDIRERARADAAHREALRHQREMVAKLTELDKAKTDFVSTVSHELRTPLTSVLGYLEMLSDGTGGELSAVQEKIVTTMASSGEHLLDLIEDLLSILTMESGGTRRDVARHDVYTLLSTVAERVGPLADKAGVMLTNLVDPDVGLIDGDLKQLERIFNNLISNAVKFTPNGGLVTIDGYLDPADHSFVIDIADTGVGIPDDEQAQLFNKFFRSSTAVKDAIPGTGLGLAITGELVALHGGEVSLTSLEGVGTTAHVVLPQSSPDHHAIDGASAEVPDELALDQPERFESLDV